MGYSFIQVQQASAAIEANDTPDEYAAMQRKAAG
jgi:hypothetical protein